MKETVDGQTPVSRRWIGWFGAAVFLTAMGLYFYYAFPRIGVGPLQPVSFSHRVHAGVKDIPCLFCHPFADQGRHAGLPVVEKCFFCHEFIIPTHPEIVKERSHYDAGKPVPWIRIYFIPDFVKFMHEPHVAWSNIPCSRCHGEVQTMDRLGRVSFQMGFCIGCHRERNAQTDCWLTCHR